MVALSAPTAGRLFALASALGYGASLPLSRLAFDEGTNALTVAFARYTALAVVLALWLAIGPRARRPLSTRERLISLVVGIAFCTVSLGTLLGATFMSVSLTVLIFYTHPSLILVTAALFDRRRPTLLELGVLVMAFIGLTLALEVRDANASRAGVVCASVAALGALASFVLIERALARADTLRATATATAAAAVGAALAVSVSGQLRLPATLTGIVLLIAVVALFAGAVLCMFMAIRLAGSVRASMLMFLEPVTAILLALVLLAEALSPLQWLGAALVVAAVAVASLIRPPGHPEELVRR